MSETVKSDRSIMRFFYRGEVERGNGNGYSWHPGYSENSEDNKPLYPWMTIAECRQQAKLAGAKPQFLVKP